MEVIATADWHLGKMQYSLLRREEDFYKSAKSIVNNIKDESIIFNAGDIFDTNKPKLSAISVVKDINNILLQKKSVMFYIEGNHDRIRLINNFSKYKSWLSFLNDEKNEYGIKLLEDGNPCIYKNFYIVGFNEQPKSELIKKLNIFVANHSNFDTDKIKVLLLHHSCSNFTNFCFEDSLMVDEIPNLDFWDYVIIGDTHVHSYIRHNNTKILSPGPIEVVSSSEIGDKKVFVIETKDSFKEKILNTRKCYKINIPGNEIPLETLEFIKEISKENPLIYINVNPNIIGLSNIYNILDLNKAVLRINFVKNNLEKDTQRLNINNDDSIMTLDQFKDFYFKYNSNKLDLHIKDAVNQITASSLSNVKEILNDYLT